MNWEIVIGISVLLGMFATVIGWSVKISASIATLTASIANLSKAIDEFKKDSRDEHKLIHAQLDDHEHRITIIENK